MIYEVSLQWLSTESRWKTATRSPTHQRARERFSQRLRAWSSQQSPIWVHIGKLKGLSYKAEEPAWLKSPCWNPGTSIQRWQWRLDSSKEAKARLPSSFPFIPHRLPAYWLVPPTSRAGLPSLVSPSSTHKPRTVLNHLLGASYLICTIINYQSGT